MKRIARNVFLINIVFCLAACGGAGSTPAPSSFVEERLQPDTSTATTAAPVEALLEASQTVETPAEIIMPTSTPTPTWAVPSGTPTPTLAITATQVLSPTAIAPAIPEVITTTTWVTATRSYRDLVVAQGERLYQVAWKQDGTALAVGTSVGAFIYDPQVLESVEAFNIGEAVYAAVFNPAEGQLALGLPNGDIQWWVAETGLYIKTFKAHRLGVRDLAFPVGSRYLVSGGDDGTVALWASSALAASGRGQQSPVNTWQAPDRVSSVDIHQDRQMIAAGSNQVVSVWSLTSGDLLTSIPDLAGWVNEIDFRPSGDSLAVVDSSSTVRIWNTSSWYLTHQVWFQELEQLVSIDFSPDGRTLALGGGNGRVVLWDLAANTVAELVDTLPDSVLDLAFSPSAETLVACYANGTLRMWSSQP